MRHFDLDALATFIAITDHNSFTLAAEELGKSQAAVSQILGRLEHRIGRRLIDRSRFGKLSLTMHGQILIEQARKLLSQEQELINAMDCGFETNCIRIGMPDDYVEVFGCLPLSNFSARYPHVQVDIHCDFSANIERLMAEGAIDLAIITHTDSSPKGESLVRVAQKWCATGRGMPENESVLPLALFAEPCRSRPSVLKALKENNRDYRIVSSSSHLGGVLATAQATPAITVLPEPVVPAGWRILGEEQGFPELSALEIELVVPEHANLMTHRLGQFVSRHFQLPQRAIA